MKAVDSTIQVNLLRIRGCISCIHFLLVLGLMPALVLAGDELPAILCPSCHQVDSYYGVMEGETLTCSFSATIQVQLEWFQQSSDGYGLVEMQSFNSTENESGTYNSLATLQLRDDDNLIRSLMCRATQPNLDWRREKEVLVDISKNESFSDIEPETQYMELNTSTLILCGGLSSSYMIWKEITSSGNPELVGFHSHIITRTTASALNIDVSADDGSLVFHYIGVHNEGIYACISGDGLSEEINVTSVEILIPPSPPYINITGCEDVFESCRLSENTTKVLECAVYGVRPAATLEWIAEDTDQISFFNHSSVSKENGDTFDTILSVEYEVSQDVLCGQEIPIQCNLHGPLSKIINAESTAVILPASCKENEETADSGLAGIDKRYLAITFINAVVMWMVVGVSCCSRFIRNGRILRFKVTILSVLPLVTLPVWFVASFWPIFPNETVFRLVFIASLVSSSVTLVLLVYLVWAFVNQEKARRRHTQNAVRRTAGHTLTVTSHGAGNRQPTGQAEGSLLQNDEGNRQPTGHAEGSLLQNDEGNGELAPTENAERLPLVIVEGNGQPTEHAERFTLQNAEEHERNSLLIASMVTVN